MVPRRGAILQDENEGAPEVIPDNQDTQELEMKRMGSYRPIENIRHKTSKCNEKIRYMV
jgi:hypothetical protein